MKLGFVPGVPKLPLLQAHFDNFDLCEIRWMHRRISSVSRPIYTCPVCDMVVVQHPVPCSRIKGLLHVLNSHQSLQSEDGRLGGPAEGPYRDATADDGGDGVSRGEDGDRSDGGDTVVIEGGAWERYFGPSVA